MSTRRKKSPVKPRRKHIDGTLEIDVTMRVPLRELSWFVYALLSSGLPLDRDLDEVMSESYVALIDSVVSAVHKDFIRTDRDAVLFLRRNGFKLPVSLVDQVGLDRSTLKPLWIEKENEGVSLNDAVRKQVLDFKARCIQKRMERIGVFNQDEPSAVTYEDQIRSTGVILDEPRVVTPLVETIRGKGVDTD